MEKNLNEFYTQQFWCNFVASKNINNLLEGYKFLCMRPEKSQLNPVPEYESSKVLNWFGSLRMNISVPIIFVFKLKSKNILNPLFSRTGRVREKARVRGIRAKRVVEKVFYFEILVPKIFVCWNSRVIHLVKEKFKDRILRCSLFCTISLPKANLEFF